MIGNAFTVASIICCSVAWFFIYKLIKHNQKLKHEYQVEAFKLRDDFHGALKHLYDILDQMEGNVDLNSYHDKVARVKDNVSMIITHLEISQMTSTVVTVRRDN